MSITSCTKELLNDMSVKENRQRVHMYEVKLVRIWDKIRKLEVTKMRLNNLYCFHVCTILSFFHTILLRIVGSGELPLNTNFLA